MIVVSDTLPIINLATVGHLHLLQKLYAQVIIPWSVYDEIALVGRDYPGAREVATFSWIQTQQVQEKNLISALLVELDPGEAEAISLAIELKADLLLLDESKGRKVAARLGLRVIGLLGILLEAKHNKLITAVKPIMDDLIARAGFWISRELYARVLQAAKRRTMNLHLHP